MYKTIILKFWLGDDKLIKKGNNSTQLQIIHVNFLLLSLFASFYDK